MSVGKIMGFQRVEGVPDRFTALFSAVADSILRFDREGRCLQAYGSRDGKFHGLAATPSIGKKLTEIYQGALGERLLDLYRKALRDRRNRSLSYFVNRKGKRLLFEAYIVPFESWQNEASSGCWLIVRDISVHKESRDYFLTLKKLIQRSSEAMLLVLPYRQEAYANDAFCRLFPHECSRLNGWALQRLGNMFGKESYSEICNHLRDRGRFRGEVPLKNSEDLIQKVRLEIETFSDPQDPFPLQLLIFSDAFRSEKEREQLYYSATHDFLTDLPNRRMLLDYLDRAVAKSRRTRRTGALFFLDLDNFKFINDSLGHTVGDLVLKTCAQRIKRVLRKSDIFGRIGGDEFLLIVEEIQSPDDIMSLSQKIIEVVSRPFEVQDFQYRIGISIGITLFPHDSADPQELIRFADTAMYQAKEEGNRYRFYSRGLDQKIRRQLLIEKALRYALQHEKFYPVFQPLLDLGTNRVKSLEVLLRIDEGIAGPLSPQEFIPIAEESDLIHSIGRWVFEKSCETLKSWQTEEIDPILLSINLSRRQLVDAQWSRFVEMTMKKYRIDPRRIEFEITETAFMNSQETGYRTIRELKQMGCSITIDDFGTGYSSLSALKKFSVDKLKIDKSIIDEISHDSTDRSIVKASIALAHALDLDIVAEGVETANQEYLVRLMGCSEIQGFLYSHPKPAEEMLMFLRRIRKGETINAPDNCLRFG